MNFMDVRLALRKPLFRYCACFLLTALASACNAQTKSSENSPPMPVPPTKFGVNIGLIATWNNTRVFANLISGSNWQLEIDKGPWTTLPAHYVNDKGWPIGAPPGGTIFRFLNQPAFDNKARRVTCRYSGKALLSVNQANHIVPISNKPGSFIFDWKMLQPKIGPAQSAFLVIKDIDPTDPIRDIDCREAAMKFGPRFSPDAVAALSRFDTIRYLGWQGTAANKAISWSKRKLPAHGIPGAGDGVSVEDLVQLANETGSNPWFTMPWNADEDYQRQFALYVRDHLKPELVAYVEMSNEVWNYGYPVAKQALQEGIALKLDDDQYRAHLLRYSQKSLQLFRIWSAVYKSEPRRIVRVMATQNANPETTKTVMSFAGLADQVDAIATAPYFPLSPRFKPVSGDLSATFEDLDRTMAASLANALEHKRLAHQFGKRFITYEAGQHVVLPDTVPLMAEINRDARMGGAYDKYLSRWSSEFGDLMVLLADVSATGRNGAWGQREYADQPLSDAPKAAALERRLRPVSAPQR